MIREVNINDIADADIRRNASVFATGAIKAYAANISENGQNFEFHIFENAERRNGPTMFVLHDDENSAFDAGVEALLRYGGRVVTIQNDDSRNVAGVDPNRIFGDEYPQYTAFLEAMINNRSGHVISIHTNRDGVGPISMDNFPNAYQGHTSFTRSALRGFYRGIDNDGLVGFSHGDDPDNLIWLAGTDPLGEERWARQFLEQMPDKRINVVYENVDNQSDGSMSNWAASNGYQYINVEGQAGQTQRIGQMLDAAFSALGVRGEALSVDVGITPSPQFSR